MRKLKYALLGVALVAALGFVTACGTMGLQMDGGSADLVGTWYWLSEPYYVFNEDGTGTMDFIPIHWGARNNVLAICVTPIMCRGRCIGPTMWNYEITGNRLVLVSQLTDRISLDYYRRP